MRLKTFHADTLSGAMELVRQTLGPNAIIVATHEDDASRGARVTAAIDPGDQDFDFFSDGASQETLEFLTGVLERHGVPNMLIDRLIDAASDGTDSSPADVLAGALAKVFKFAPLPERPGGVPIMLIGPPGVGKTVSCAKIAARAARGVVIFMRLFPFSFREDDAGPCLNHSATSPKPRPYRPALPARSRAANMAR